MTNEIFHYNLSSVDNNILTPLTGVSSLKVKTHYSPESKREVIFWYDREQIPNPEKVVNPGIRMNLTFIEELSPNKFLIKDFENREYNLELLYVE